MCRLICTFVVRKWHKQVFSWCGSDMVHHMGIKSYYRQFLLLLRIREITCIQATPAMSTSRISILSLMSKWFFIPNIFTLYIFAFQLRLCRKWLTWSNRYLEVIFHALDVFSVTFATACVEVKNRPSQGRRIVCFGYVYALTEVQTSSKQWSKTIKVLKLLSIE